MNDKIKHTGRSRDLNHFIKIIQPTFTVNSDVPLVRLLNNEIGNYCILFNNRIYIFESLSSLISTIKLVLGPSKLGSLLFLFGDNCNRKIIENDTRETKYYRALETIHELENMKLLAMSTYTSSYPSGLLTHKLRASLQIIISLLEKDYPEYFLWKRLI